MNILGGKLPFKVVITLVLYSSSLMSCYGAGNVSSQRNCRGYGEQSVELEGVVSASPFNWPKKQRLDHYASFTIHLREPICVGAGKDELESAFEDIRNVELGVMNAKEYREIRDKVGMRVRCNGNIQPAISGHHANSIILWNSKCGKI